MNIPKISVITVCFNSAKTIRDTLDSVAGQTYQNIEHIVVDGGSTDDTLAIIENHRDKLATVVSEPDQGIFDAMNKGLKLVTGEVVGFLNADDVYANEDVLQQVAQVFAAPDVDACYADLVYVDRVDLNRVVRYWKSCDYKEGLFKKGWAPAHPTFFACKTAYEKYGDFDLNYNLAADFELMMRFLEKWEINSIYIPRVFVKMRLGGVSNKNIANIVKQNIDIYRAGKKNNVEIAPASFIFSKIIARISQRILKPTNDA